MVGYGVQKKSLGFGFCGSLGILVRAIRYGVWDVSVVPLTEELGTARFTTVGGGSGLGGSGVGEEGEG